MKNPFYCRSAVFIEAQDWLRLRDKFLAIKKEWLGLEPWQAVKWSYIWSLFKHRQNGETVPPQKPYYFLRKHSLDVLIAFVCLALQLLFETESSRIMLTVTFNEQEKTKPVERKQLIRMHLAQALKMAEKEMRKRKENALGWGISEIPKSQKNRAFLEGTIKKIFATQAKNYKVSLEERLKK